MEWLLLLGAALVVIALVLKNSANGTVENDQSLYQKKKGLLTAAERSFYGVLLKAVSADTVVFSKVRVADILEPIKGLNRSDWQQAFNKIQAKHFDFVLCDNKTLAVKMVVELDDSSHQRQSRTQRDEFLDLACKLAKLDLKRIKAQRAYSIEEVKSQLLGVPFAEVVNSAPEIQSVGRNDASDFQVFDLHMSAEGFAKVSAELKRLHKRTSQIYVHVGVEGDLKNQVLRIGRAKNGVYNRWMQAGNGHKNTFFWATGASDSYTQRNADEYANYLLFLGALYDQKTKLYVIDVAESSMLAREKELIKEYSPIWEQFRDTLKYSKNYPTLTGKDKDLAVIRAVAKLGAATRLIVSQRNLGDDISKKLPDIISLGIRSLKEWSG